MKHFSITVLATVLALGAFAEVKSSNTLAQMAVTSDATWTLLALPWVTPGAASDSQDIVLTNLVVTMGLSEGDLLMRHKGSGQYECWKIEGCKWKPATTVTETGVTLAADPDSASFPRGIGVWLKRKDTTKPILLYGQVKSDNYGSVTVPANTTALVACPKATDFALKDFACGGDKDMIRVQFANNDVRYYYWKLGRGWCTPTVKEVDNPFGGKTKETVYTQTTDVIPSGIGFFYTNAGNEPRELTWDNN